MSDSYHQSLTTAAVHSGETEDELRTTAGDVVAPIHLATHHAMASPGDAPQGYKYSRFGNPTRDALETRLARLTGADDATAFGSGTAAIATTALACCDAGDHVVAFDSIYGGTRVLFDEFLADRLGVDVTYVDATDPDAITAAIRPETGLVWLESPTNPLLKLCDLEAAAEIATRHEVTLGVDNTFATPYVQRPLESGADVVVHSTTKYLNGHSDSTGGVAATNDPAIADEIATLQAYALGNIMPPFDAYLVLRGTKTFPLRMDRHQRNAHAVAEYLDDHRSVRTVHYPGLDTHPQHDLARHQMDGFGGVVAAELDATEAETRAVIDQLDVFTTAVSLGGAESLVDHPWTMSASFMDPDDRRDAGLSERLIRLPVGIEHEADLLADLEQALAHL